MEKEKDEAFSKAWIFYKESDPKINNDMASHKAVTNSKYQSLEKKYLVGECKFKNEKMDRNVYETLVRRSSLIPLKYQKIPPYLFFSLSGFSPWMIENAKDSKLITLEDMYNL